MFYAETISKDVMISSAMSVIPRTAIIIINNALIPLVVFFHFPKNKQTVVTGR